MTEAFIALGSNLGDAHGQVLGAFDALNKLPRTRLLDRSPLYLTPPWGVVDQPAFVNAVARIDTALSPHDLLDALLAVERAAGRVRDGERWGPRTLDLDVLHMDGVVLSDERLTLPHPRIADRAFVLLPLHALAPDLLLPGQGRVADLLATVDAAGCERLP
ncbi:2-amino-4-hydroxy-6-hydroxymethyldihydropteridine diphosphokinase [Dyella telluris]|uniref:2-amino-4-hydroxy-6-hydroxymethyldihydropteridine pyrophosphokinase n=1 Tax=Dyella telluris TaxID=2763498 RepID=A0A7G8Q697_9GAMM|nr:2-amino-4-hydroxy-6-hydroxymethyldihydropteridine diphosphokinase [Dyella telluris]QNK02305.1 2-amino-4-hydroxy-6-hydroxymethyldihydropteridine diphosphokinase [Dyella telluris]